MSELKDLSIYTDVLETQLKQLGYETTRRKDDNGSTYITFPYAVDDSDYPVIVDTGLFSLGNRYGAMQFYFTLAVDLNKDITQLEKDVMQWNVDGVGVYGIYYPEMSLFYRQVNMIDENDTPDKIAQLALFTLVFIQEELKPRIEAIKDYTNWNKEDGIQPS